MHAQGAEIMVLHLATCLRKSRIPVYIGVVYKACVQASFSSISTSQIAKELTSFKAVPAHRANPLTYHLYLSISIDCDCVELNIQ